MNKATPHGWQQRSISELVTLQYGKSPKDVIDVDGKYPIIGTGGITGNSNAYLHEGGTSVVGRKGTINKPSYVDEKFWAIDTTYYGENYKQSEPKWFFYNLQNTDLAKYNEASGVPSLNRDTLYSISLNVPPLPEQKKIASILTSVDEVIEKTESQIAKLQDLKTGMMQELLTKGIGHSEFKDSPVGRIPVGWGIETIGKIFSLQLGKMLSKAAKVGDSPLPYLGNKNIQWDRVDLTHLEQMDFSERERKKYSLRFGDLLMCEGGDVGRCAIWRDEMTACYYQKAIHRLRPIDDLYHPVLLLEYMKFAKQRNLLVNFVSQTSIAHLTREKLSTIPIPVPPKDEQSRIVDISVGIENKILKCSERRKKLGDYKKALMQDLLTGKVRVQTD